MKQFSIFFFHQARARSLAISNRNPTQIALCSLLQYHDHPNNRLSRRRRIKIFIQNSIIDEKHFHGLSREWEFPGQWSDCRLKLSCRSWFKCFEKTNSSSFKCYTRRRSLMWSSSWMNSYHWELRFHPRWQWSEVSSLGAQSIRRRSISRTAIRRNKTLLHTKERERERIVMKLRNLV